MNEFNETFEALLSVQKGITENIKNFKDYDNLDSDLNTLSKLYQVIEKNVKLGALIGDIKTKA